MSSAPPASAYRTGRLLRETGLAAAFPADITVAGMQIRGVNVVLEPVQLEIPGQGLIERRSLSTSFLKTQYPGEPIIGAQVIHQDQTYVIKTIEGREDYSPAWTITAIELDRAA